MTGNHMPYYVGTDIGGTFTDCVVMDDRGRMTVSKTSSSPDNFAEGLISALGEAALSMGRSLEELLSDTRLFSHGCTVATNALVVLTPGSKLTEDEFIQFCKSKMAFFKVPKVVEFRDSLPKGPTGKVLKKALKQAGPVL